jgi:hypothetical protein
MKLADLQRSGKGGKVYSKTLSDRSGNESYELSVVGPSAVAGQVFKKCEFEIEIDVDVATDAFQERSKKFFSRYVQAEYAGHPEPEVIAGLIGRKLPGVSSAKDSLVVYLRRTKGDGTFWSMFFPALVVPPGLSLFFVLPRVWATFGDRATDHRQSRHLLESWSALYANRFQWHRWRSEHRRFRRATASLDPVFSVVPNFRRGGGAEHH